jgi:tyrosine-protein phosphatase SIW14
MAIRLSNRNRFQALGLGSRREEGSGCTVRLDALSTTGLGVGSATMRFTMFSKSTVFTTVAIALIVIGGVASYKLLRWKNFAEVDHGRVYRSGQLSERQLESALTKHGIKRVVCLNPDYAERERALCKKLGVEFHLFPMPSDGRGALEQFTAVYRLMNDGAPTLVHCSAGVARTGVACALYRIHHDGWTTDKALDELRSFERRGRMTVELQQHVRQMAVQVGDALKR